jgi:ABC-type dipeptide/oligopeptide/nickel transport system permease component
MKIKASAFILHPSAFSSMARFLITRFSGMAFVLLIVSFLTFALMYNVPGGPFDQNKQPLSEAAMANIKRKYGLDQPFYVQWGRYVINAVQGDFGTSYVAEGDKIVTLFGKYWGASLIFGALSLAWSIPLGLILGVWAAIKRNTLIDYVVTLISVVGITVPVFALGIFGLYLFSIRWKLLPYTGWDLVNEPLTAVLPVIIFGLLPLGTIARYTRAGMLEVLAQDYVRTARAKGLTFKIVVLKHALRNALIPILTVIGPFIPNALTGSAILERMFNIPGVGRYFIDSIQARDYPVIMATVLIVAVLWGITYLLTDLLYTVADPRIRIDGSKS